MRPHLMATAALSLITAIAIICQTYLLAHLIDGLAIDEKVFGQLSTLVWALLAILMVRAVLLFGQETLANHIALSVKIELRKRISQALLHLGPAYVDHEQTGELVTTAVDGVETLDDYFARYLPRGLHMAVVPPVILIVVALIDPLSGLVLLVTGPLIPFLMWLIGTWARERTRKQWEAMGLMSAHFLDVLQGLKTLQLFGRAEHQSEKIKDVSDRFRKTTMSVLIIAFLSSFFLELSAAISTAIVAVEVGIRIIEGHLDFATGLFVLLLAPEYYLPFRRFGTAHHAGMEGTAAAERIFELLDAAEHTQKSQTPPRTDLPGDGVRPFSISFCGVSLTYPERDTPALEDVHLKIPAGSTCAIVGPSGAGKTSLTRLLMGFQNPTRGHIEVDGSPLSQIDKSAWRRQVALVSQSPHIFSGTLRDNLLIARPDVGAETLERALEDAQALDFARNLPRGLDTPLGEGGARLSGGECQRLAIARAFLKDAPLIVMDEPSSQLDPLTEHRLSLAFRRLVDDRTAIIVAHRLNTVMQADQIAVFDGGHLLELGDHRQLLTSGGLYASMVSAADRGLDGQADGEVK